MTASICPIGDFVDYITDPKNVWDPSKYLDKRRVSGETQKGAELNLSYNYVLGNSYMVGTFGRTSLCKIEVFYRDIQGFQVKIQLNDSAEFHDSFTPQNKEKVKELLLRYADL